MRSEHWLILQTGTKTIPIIFQNHRFLIDPPTPVITCFFSSTHYIFVNKLVVFTICLDNCPFSWQVTSGPNNNIFPTFLCHPLKNEYHQEQNIFHWDQTCPNWCDTGSKFPWDVHVSIISHVKIYVHQCLPCVSSCAQDSYVIICA
jgi:hypothetical protein